MKHDRARLVANPALCDGHGICVLRAPDLLTLDAWGFVGVETAEALSGRDLRRAASAVAACPERALSLAQVDVAAGNRCRSWRKLVVVDSTEASARSAPSLLRQRDVARANASD